MTFTRKAKWVGGVIATAILGLTVTAVWQAPTVLATKTEVRVAESKADFVNVQLINTLHGLIKTIEATITETKTKMPAGPDRDDIINDHKQEIEKIEDRIDDLQGVLLR